MNGSSARWLARGFPWVYPGEVARRPRGLRPGHGVRIVDSRGLCLGTGIWDEGWIAVRRFRHDDGPLDRAMVRARLGAALALRAQVIDPRTTAYRLLHAENDHMPGLRADRWGQWLVVSLDSPALLPLLDPLCDELNERLEPRGIALAWRPDPREKDRAFPPGRLLRGEAPDGLVRVTERGVACLVDPMAGRSAGLFTDMRDNRAWLEPHWRGRRVLNLFAHTAVFSVAAAVHGARSTTSVDLSPRWLERARLNFAANDLPLDGHRLVAQDVRKALDRFRRRGRRFDLAVLDPPAFSTGPAGSLDTGRALATLVASTLRVLEPGGWLAVALHRGDTSPKAFHRRILAGASKAGRRLQLLHEGGQAPDHPAAAWFPEGRYLKFGVWRALG